MMVVGFQPYAPATFTPRKYSWYSCLLETESTPETQCNRKDFMSMKNPLTPAGIEPAIFRFVAQHLNLCATAIPTVSCLYMYFNLCWACWYDVFHCITNYYYYYYVTFTLTCQLSGGSLLGSPVLNNRSKRFHQALTECSVQCSLVWPSVVLWPTGALAATDGSDLILS